MSRIGGHVIGAKATDGDSGYTYEPWCGNNGEMGYRVTSPDGNMSYFYLNPSLGSDDGEPTVFVYHDSPDAAVPTNSLHYYYVRDN